MPDTKTKGANKTQGAEDEKPVKVNKWDGNAIKNALDDAVRKLISERYDYTERTRFIDIRLCLATVAVGFALFALLWDWLHPFPKSRCVLICCVVAYFLLMTVLQLYAMYVEKGTFFVAVDEDPTGHRSDRYWYFSSTMKKYDHNYTLEISYESADKTSRGQASLTKSVGVWFDENGTLTTDLIAADVYKLHDSLMSTKKDK